MRQKNLYVEDDQKYLIEDMDIKNGDVITVKGTQVTNPNFGNMLNITLLHDKLSMQVKISNECTVKGIINLINQTNLFIPHSIKIKYNGTYLTNDYGVLVEYGIKNNSTIEFSGTYFPVGLFPGYSFLENHGVYKSTDCIICLEKNNGTKIFECGHSNICNSCVDKYDNINCPICKK
jgi:hypothetical protein